MKKLIPIICVITLLSAGIAIGTKWSDYTDQTAGNIAGVDTFLVRDVSDTTLAATGTQKEYPWSVLLSDLISVGSTSIVVADGDTTPGVNDDINGVVAAATYISNGAVPTGYSVGDIFINDTADPTLVYQCIINTDGVAVWQELTGDGTFEPIDAAIVKSDEAETLTANWVNTTNPWADNEIVNDHTHSELDVTPLTTTPDPPELGVKYWADSKTWNPVGSAITIPYETMIVGVGTDLFDDSSNGDFEGGAADWNDGAAGAAMAVYNDTTDLSLEADGVGDYAVLLEAEMPMTQNNWYVLQLDAAAIVGSYTITDFDGAFEIGTIDTNGTIQRFLFKYEDASAGGLRFVAVTAVSDINIDNITLEDATWKILLDEDANWHVSGISAQTPVTDDADDFDNAGIFTGPNLYGGTFIADGTGTVLLPVMAEGMNFCVITLGAIAVIIDTNAADGYLMDGTTGTEGKNLTNLTVAGDIACLQYYTADDWLITTNGWTPE